jgi:hypothetical protein
VLMRVTLTQTAPVSNRGTYQILVPLSEPSATGE